MKPSLSTIIFLLITSVFISCGGGGNLKGLKIPAEGLYFEVDEKDHHVLKGHNQNLDVELGKLNMGTVTITVKSGSDVISSGNLSEIKPLTFQFDSIGYKISMTGSDYNLIAASVVKLKVEPFASLSLSDQQAYHSSAEFDQAIQAKFNNGYAFEIKQRSGHSITIGNATLNVVIGDISEGRGTVQIELDNAPIHSAILKPNQSTLFQIGNTQLALNCLKYSDELIDIGYFSIQTATPEMIANISQNQENNQASVVDNTMQGTENIPEVATNGFAVPAQGMSIEIAQRSSKKLTGKKKVFTISIGDITKGKTTIDLSEDGKPILGETISEGDQFIFKFESKTYTIECVDLINDLVGQDQGIFLVKNK